MKHFNLCLATCCRCGSCSRIRKNSARKSCDFRYTILVSALVVIFGLDFASAADDAQQALESAQQRYWSLSWEPRACEGIPQTVMGLRVTRFDDARRVELAPVEKNEDQPKAAYVEFVATGRGISFRELGRLHLLDRDAHKSNLFRGEVSGQEGSDRFHIHLVGFAHSDLGSRLFRITASGRDEKQTTELARRIASLAQRTIAAREAERKRIAGLIKKHGRIGDTDAARLARHAEFIRKAFGKLSDDELLKHYEVAGLTLQHGFAAVSDEPFSGPGGLGDHSATRYFAETRIAIIWRGAAIVPELIEFLRKEISLRRPLSPYGPGRPGFVGDTLKLLTEIGDPRPVELLVEIIDGFGGKATRFHRETALPVVERLTYCSFRKSKPRFGHDSHIRAVEHPSGAVSVEHVRAEQIFNEVYPAIANKYRDWLQGEGKDPARWLPLAIERARKMLASDDPDAIFSAARFFAHDPRRDDQPDKTLARLAEVIDELKPTDDPNVFTYRGAKTSMTPDNWKSLLEFHKKMQQRQKE